MSRRNRALLHEKLNCKLRELTQYTKRMSDLISEPSADPVDEAQLQIPADVAVCAINIDWKTSKAVEAALNRLQSGDYGFCDSCAEPIHPKRLQVIPWAGLCARCQSEMEAVEGEVRVYQQVA